MLGSNSIGDSTLGTRTRLASRWGMLCGGFGILFWCLGAQCLGLGGPQPVACTAATAAADCDDDDACTTDTCAIAAGATEGECDNTAACEDDHCTDTGCVACIADDECGDAVECTTDACGDDGTCSNTADDTACDDSDDCTDDSCDAAAGCANTQIDCDDTVACTDDGCAAAACTHTDNCAAGSACNEDTGLCVLACDSADVCDDGDDCTDDDCVNLACSNTAVDCDDEVACTDDSCDAGACVNADNCTAPETCNLTSGLCEEVPACVTDADCAETPTELFCNGVATCDVDTGDCIAGARPCADTKADGTVGVCGDAGVTETCAQGDTAAVCTACPPITFDFTLSGDNLPGTTGNDTFSAPLIFNAGNGAQIASLQTGDSANGLAGTDTLNASFAATASNTVVPTLLSGIEVLNFTDFTAAGFTTTLSAVNVSGVTDLNSVNSTNTLTVTGLSAIANIGLTNATGGVNVTFNNSALTGTGTPGDQTTLALSGITTGTATIQGTSGTNGFETINISSGGTSPNTLTSLSQGGGNTTLTRLNVTGAQNLKLTTIPGTVLTVDANAMTTGGLTLGTGTGATGDAFVAFTAANNNMNVINGGGGNDTFIFGTFLSDGLDFDAAGEGIDGNGGTDTVQATFTAGPASALRLTEIEEMVLNATGATNLILTGVTGLTKFIIRQDAIVAGSQTALTLTNFGGTPALEFRGDGAATSQFFDAVTYTSASSATNDSLAITVGNRVTALGAAGTTNVFNVGAISAAGMETINITVADTPSDGDTIFNGVVGSTVGTMTVIATGDLVLGTVDNGTTTDTITSITGTGVVGSLTGTSFRDLRANAVITLGSGNDVVTLDTNTGTSITIDAGSGNDTVSVVTDTVGTYLITGGLGDDTLSGSDLGDTLNGGTGNDKFRYFDSQTTATRDTISGFTAGSTDDRLEFDVDAGGATATGFTGADVLLQTGSGAATSTDVAANATVAFQTIAAAGAVTTTAANNVIIFSGAVFTSAAVIQTAVTGGANSTVITFSNAADSGSFVAAYDDGVDTFICLINVVAATTTGAATVTDLVRIQGVADVTTLTIADFAFLSN